MFARRVAVIGTGYVGLTTGACLASLGHRVGCADLDAAKVERLRRGEVGIREAGLAELVEAGIAAGRLSFVVGAAAALAELAEREGPPRSCSCACRPRWASAAWPTCARSRPWSRRSARLLAAGRVVVNKSTVPVGTAARTAELLRPRRTSPSVSNPEFLREGSAVHDFLNPDRIVVGCEPARTPPSGSPPCTPGSARRRCSPTRPSAEMIKYAANCFLAMKLSYVNALAELCERLGRRHRRRHRRAWASTGASARRSSRPGPGWGGSCLPKDTHALLQVADSVDFEFRLLRATIDTNTRQRQRIVDKIRAGGHGRAAGLAGASAGWRCSGSRSRRAPTTCATRPRSAVAALLRQAGAELIAYDPGLPAAGLGPGRAR